jgi:prevent-host-death family protein
VSVSEAKAKLSELLRAAERGETVVIVRHGRAVARLTPPSPWPEAVAEAPVQTIDVAALERDGIVRRPAAAPDAGLLDRPELAVPSTEGVLGRMLRDLDEDREERARDSGP